MRGSSRNEETMAATKGFTVTSPLSNNVMLTQYQHSHTSLNPLEDALDLAWFTHTASTMATNLRFFYVCARVPLRYPGILGRRKWRPKEEIGGNGRAGEGERGRERESVEKCCFCLQNDLKEL